ncbi:FecR domain-containing protein [Salinispira pacifica]|uniref:FecR protein domain-containing protein n=1 Tax=Salinispira pacifica TaxID=1307761 RepID=V5WJA5_9SPIO|nr:FecR domain-containing protein [Salinispira pacifica]AHC15863.1 hypothetical protein L21SP2_2511 [Salinispira pacifica]
MKNAIVISALLLAAAALSANSVGILEMEGRVYHAAENGSWQLLTADSSVESGTRIFASQGASLSLDINGDQVDVRSLSDFDIVDDGTDGGSTSLYVRSGGLRSRVKKADTEDMGIRYEIQSPVATASVRGTVFTFNGSNLVVEEGDVELKNLLGQTHSVRANQRSRAYGTEGIRSVEVYLRQNTSVE